MAPPLLTHSERPQGTLDERIAQAEQRLVAREHALRDGAQALLQRVRVATEPRRMLRPAATALGVLVLLWGAVWVIRGRRGAARPGTSTASAQVPAPSSRSRFGELPWERAAALLWPLLPLAWRGRMGPEAASILVAVVLPLAGLLFRKRDRASTPPRPPE